MYAACSTRKFVSLDQVHSIKNENYVVISFFHSTLQYQEDLNELNEIARHRPRSALIMNLAQENSQIRELQQENRVRSIMQQNRTSWQNSLLCPSMLLQFVLSLNLVSGPASGAGGTPVSTGTYHVQVP